MQLSAGFPRASWSNLMNSTPLCMGGLQTSSTAVGAQGSINFATGTTGETVQAVAGTILTAANAYARMRSMAASEGTNSNEVLAACLALNAGSAVVRNALANTPGNLSATVGGGYSPIVNGNGEWTVTHTPAANTQATASKAAGGAGVMHVAKSITATLSCTAAGGAPIQVNLRDGASGAGTIKWTAFIGVAVANNSTTIFLSGLNIYGTANTAMTLEFAGAGGANTQESVTLSGYSTT